MTVGKAQTRISTVDRLNQTDAKIREQRGLDRRNRSGNPTRVGSSSSTSPPQVSPSQTGLPIVGGQMSGPIGFTRKIISLVGATIDISQTSAAYSTYVTIDSNGAETLLETIAPGAFDGQLLFLFNSAGRDLTLKQAVSLGWNIDTVTHSDITFSSTDTIVLVYQQSLKIWHQITPGGGGGFANTSLSNLVTTAINQNLIFGAGMSDSSHSKDIVNVHQIQFSSTGGSSSSTRMTTGNTPSSFAIELGTQTSNSLLYLGSNSETNLQLYGSPSGAQAAPIMRLFTQRTPTNGMLCGTYSFDGNDDFNTQQQFVLLQGIARNKNRSLSNLAGAMDVFVWSQNNTSAQTKVATFEGDTTNLGTAGGLTPGLNMNNNQIFGASYFTFVSGGIQQFNGAGSTLVTTSLNLSGSSNLLTQNITDGVHTEKGFTWQIGTFDIVQILNNHGFVVSSDVGFVNFTSQNSYITATAGTHAVPALAEEYLIVLKNGIAYKIALFGL